MIRLRNKDGATAEVPDIAFVEILGADKKLLTVLMQPSPGTVVQIQPGSNEAARYEQMFHREQLKFKPVITLP